MPRAEPGGQVREEKAVALRGLNADKSELKRLLRPAPRDVGINGPAIQDEDLRRAEGIEVRAGEELLGDLPTGDIIYFEGSSCPGGGARSAPQALRTPGDAPDWRSPARRAGHSPARTRRLSDAGCHAPGPG